MDAFTQKNPRWIIAAAAKFEAQESLTALDRRGVSFTFLEVGIGAIRSAQQAMALCGLITERDVIFIGSCGVSQTFDRPYLIAPSHVVWAPVDVRSKQSYLVTGAEPDIHLKPFVKLPAAKVSCSSSITLQDAQDPEIYENLELYSVASAWLPRCKSFTAILGVTNQLGPDAHQQWKTNHREVASMTARYLESNF